jgi:hypothetical protein
MLKIAKIVKLNFLPMGHSCDLQGAFSVLDPGQAAPPLDGGGLLQSLV